MADLEIFTHHDITPGVTVLERRAASGWAWNLGIVALPGGGTAVYSPSWLDDATLDRVASVGEPRVLIAPNAYHHVTLPRFQERFPRALVVASAEARPALAKKGRKNLVDLDEALPLLPTGSQWYRCEATKTGEAWLVVPHAAGRTLFVCDAFFNLTHPTSGFVGWVLRRLKVAPGLRISTTYQMLAVKHVGAYVTWAKTALAAIAPTEVVFSHGETIKGPDCGARLLAAIDARWPKQR